MNEVESLEAKREKKRISNKKYREENKEKLAEYKREYDKNNPDKKKRWNQKHYSTDKYRESRKRYRAENGDFIRGKMRDWYRRNANRAVLNAIRKRAEIKGIPFDLDLEDISDVPEFCPVLGIKLIRCANENGSIADCTPTVDRIIPELGYIKGNVIIVSHRANRIKNNATVEELKAIADFYSRIMSNKK